MSGTLEVSVLICTRNRPEKLATCLSAIRGLAFDGARWELVVVDNGPDEKTASVVRAFAMESPVACRRVVEPKAGLAYARNTGVRAAKAPLIVFVDDDCYVEPDYLTKLVEVFATKGYGYVGGRVLLHDPSDAPVTIREDDGIEEVPGGSFVRPGFLHGASMAFRRGVWESLDGFDVRLGAGTRFSSEDLDFVGRASAAGWSGAYIPAARVRHHHGRKAGPDVDALLAGYQRGIAAYLVRRCRDPRTRRQALGYWYWRLATRVRRGRFREVAAEFAAVVEYVIRSR